VIYIYIYLPPDTSERAPLNRAEKFAIFSQLRNVNVMYMYVLERVEFESSFFTAAYLMICCFMDLKIKL